MARLTVVGIGPGKFEGLTMEADEAIRKSDIIVGYKKYVELVMPHYADKEFFDNGAKEVHVRISCPPLVYGCPFIGFTASKSDLELITRRIIRDFEGDDKANLDKYAQTGSPEYERMVAEIGRRLGLSSVKFAHLEDLITSIGLPKEKVCTHCFDGSSYDQQHEGDYFG